MKIQIPPQIRLLGEAFGRSGLPLYMVGGAVRNALLGYPPNDYDLCGPATPEQVIKGFQNSSVQVVPIAPAFGTVLLYLPKGEDKAQRAVEYTTFRRDTYGPGGGHRPDGVLFSEKLEEDSFRRDFTLNALYAYSMTGELIDPTRFLEDMEKRLIRTSSPDPDLILRDAGLRTLRLVRFASELGFEVDTASADIARRHASLLAAIPVERN